MAREIPLDGIAQFTKGNLEKLVRAVALEADAHLKPYAEAQARIIEKSN